MFNINLLNSPGIQTGDENNVISFRSELETELNTRNGEKSTQQKGNKSKSTRNYLAALVLSALIVSFFFVKMLYEGSHQNKMTIHPFTADSIGPFPGLLSIFNKLPENIQLDEIIYSVGKINISFFSSDIASLNEINNSSLIWNSNSGKINGDIRNGGFLEYEIYFDMNNSFVYDNIITQLYKYLNEKKVGQITEGTSYIQFHADVQQIEGMITEIISLPFTPDNYIRIIRIPQDPNGLYQVRIEATSHSDDNNYSR